MKTDSEKLKSGIYKISNKVDGKCYIGSAKNIKIRWKIHKSDLRLGKHHSIKLQRAWNKYSANSFIFSIIERCETERLLEREQYWLDFLNPVKHGYNILFIAGTNTGAKRSKETCERISQSLIGRKLSMNHRNNISKAHIGKVLSDETKKKMSVFQTGKKLSEPHKKKLSAAATGRKHTIETKYKISAAQMGNKKAAKVR